MSIGLEVIRSVEARLMIDDEWIVRRPDGSEWVGWRLCQGFQTSLPYEDLGILLQRVHVTVPLVRGVRRDPAQVMEILGMLNAQAVGSALVFDAERREIVTSFWFTVHDETRDYRADLIQAFAIIQLVRAERMVEWLADACQGAPAFWAHPRNGPRHEADDMLNVVDAYFAPHAADPSRFADADEFAAAERAVNEVGLVCMGSSAQGMTVETGFGRADTTLIQLHSDQVHPLLGTGLLVTMKVRTGLEAPAFVVANDLNLRGARGECLSAPGMGAWCTPTNQDPDPALLAHAFFVPDVLCRPGMTMDVLMGTLMQAQWVDALINGGSGRDEGRAWAALRERLLGGWGDLGGAEA